MKNEWDYEPNKAQWIHSNLDCLIVRNDLGALCGYVGVPVTHPYFEKHYSEVPIYPHGGLTYSGLCAGEICHHGDVQNSKVWWLGFDCAHAYDFCPAIHTKDSVAEYRNIEYVTEVVNGLAEKLSEIRS